MKKFTKTVAALLLGMAIFTSCDQSLTEDLVSTNETIETSELSSDEINSAIETMAFKYNISAIADDDSEVLISNDKELSEYVQKNRKARIVFPIDITVDGETITVNSKGEMKALVGKKKRGHNKPPFKLVFPVTVSTESGSIEIEDKEAFKAYRESLEKGTHPTFIYPISVIVDEETIVINSEEELKALRPEKGERRKRPELVFPVSVTTEAGDIEIADKEAMKTYKGTLEKGTHPAFVFPISLIINEDTVTVTNEDELKALFPKKGKGPKGDRAHGERPNRPKLIFPISVTTDAGDIEIADKEAMKVYVDTLEKGTHPTFVFPISLLINKETVTVNSEEELKALKPKKGRKK
jgi:hypothetical protein